MKDENIETIEFNIVPLLSLFSNNKNNGEIERIEISINAFMPLFFKIKEDDKGDNGFKKIKKEKGHKNFWTHKENGTIIFHLLKNNAEDAARLLFQKRLETGEENMVCADVMSILVGGDKVMVDFALAYYREYSDGENKKYQKIEGVSSKRLYDFRIYNEFVEKVGVKGLKKLKVSDVENLLLNDIKERRVGKLNSFHDKNVDFSYIVDVVEKTCINKNRYDENNTLRIIYRDDTTGWRCIFSIKERYDSGEPKILRLIDIYNSEIDEELKDIRQEDRARLLLNYHHNNKKTKQ